MAVSNIGWSIMHTAFRRGLQQIVVTLINKGISIHKPLDTYGISPLEMAHSRISTEHVVKTYVTYHSGQRKSNKELEAIAIAVVGGILMTGGFGTIIGVVFGAVTFGLVANAVFFIPWIDGAWFRVFVGTVLLAAVFANERIRKRITGGI